MASHNKPTFRKVWGQKISFSRNVSQFGHYLTPPVDEDLGLSVASLYSS